MSEKLRILLIIGIGGFIGSCLRYLFSLFVHNRIPSIFPLGTLAVNIVGCLFIGFFFGLTEKANVAPEWRLFFATGLCGGFTTFSAFSIETMVMLREGQMLFAFTYIGASIFFGLIATIIGVSVFRFF